MKSLAVSDHFVLTRFLITEYVNIRIDSLLGEVEAEDIGDFKSKENFW